VSGPEGEEESEEQVPTQATRRGGRAPALPRTAEQVIDQAIGDNKLNEYLLYGFASVLVFCGVAVLVVGAYRGEGLVALAGSISSGLFFPAMNEARKIRRENIAIRLLERPLSMAETSHEAADALKEFFLDTFISRRANP
jgi:hypothetical protein